MYGVIDIGSNTIRLVIYRVDDGRINAVLNKKYMAGLAGYIGKDNHMSQDGIDLTVKILLEFQRILQSIRIDAVFPFATASLRNISNSEAVVRKISTKSGMAVRVLSGQEEAIFDYYGAVRSTNLTDGLLVDVGGGSTELVYFRKGEVLTAESIPIGSLNLHQRFVTEIVPTEKEMDNIRDEVLKQLKNANLPKKIKTIKTMCAVGGTARGALNLLNPDKRQYSSKKLKKLIDCYEETPAEVIAQILKCAPERIHTILPGIMILYAIADSYHVQSIVTSLYGVREGYLYQLLEESEKINEK